MIVHKRNTDLVEAVWGTRSIRKWNCSEFEEGCFVDLG